MATGRRRGRALCAGPAAMALGLLLGACQNYEAVPIQPRAMVVTKNVRVVTGKPLASNVMLVVDKSGSMTQSVTGSGPACTVDGKAASRYDPTSTNPCKWNGLKDALTDPVDGFLVQNEGVARFGLLAFPGDDAGCSPGRIVVPIGAGIAPIRNALLSDLLPDGGTPTTAALLEAAKDPGLASAEPNRKCFVMLLTDGLPNCNDSNAGLCAQCRSNAASCSSQSGCRPTEPPYDQCEPKPFDGAACLDEENLIGAIQELRAKGIVTLVIGFGRATASGNASRVLNRAAIEGGHPRQGATESYYQANTVEELKGFLQELLQEFPCEIKLEPKPTAANLVTVNVRDTKASTGADNILKLGRDWEFTSEDLGGIRLLGSWCSFVQNAEFGRYELQVIYADPL
jgi:hypothetical protein